MGFWGISVTVTVIITVSVILMVMLDTKAIAVDDARCLLFEQPCDGGALCVDDDAVAVGGYL